MENNLSQVDYQNDREVNKSHINAPYRFSAEELRVLKECNDESFYQRSLPLGSFLGLSTYIAVQKGIFKPSVRYGPAPKVTLAVVIGYFLGKFSYQEKCAQKLMALPDSYIGQQLRVKKQGRLGFKNNESFIDKSMFELNPNDVYSDAKGPSSTSSLDIDTARPIFDPGDDKYSEGYDKVDTSMQPLPPSAGASYDEIRKLNRSGYTEGRNNPYRVEPKHQQPEGPITPRPRNQTNTYGDTWD